MSTVACKSRFVIFDARRKELGMSRAIVAKLSGVSAPTVTRILTGREESPTIRVLQAIAVALRVEVRLGEEITVEPIVDGDEVRKQRASLKARRLVRRLQGTMGLEEQAVDAQTAEKLVERTVIELLAGSRRKLWED